MSGSGDGEPLSVWEVLRRRRDDASRPGRRNDPYRVVVGIEGGGMRGAISAGMAAELHDSGLLPAVDAVYGSSAGAISGAWLVSSNPQGLEGYADPQWVRRLASLQNLLRRSAYVNISGLIEHVYVHEFPLDYDSVLRSEVPLHTMATDATTGAAVDLRPLITSSTDLRVALRASCALPIVTGRPVRFAGRQLTDAGLSESVPLATAVQDGATHVLLLRTRGLDYVQPRDPEGLRRFLLATILRATGHGSAVAEAMATRTARATWDSEAMASGWADGPDGRVRVATVWPHTGIVVPSRIERDGGRLRAGFEGGRASFHNALQGSAPGAPRTSGSAGSQQ